MLHISDIHSTDPTDPIGNIVLITSIIAGHPHYTATPDT